jgi:hypothetical protein
MTDHPTAVTPAFAGRAWQAPPVRLSAIDRFLPLGIVTEMGLGILLGRLAPSVGVMPGSSASRWC